MGTDNPKNPWGRKPSGQPDPWGRGTGGGSGGDLPPDLDEMMRRARARFRAGVPGGWGPERLAAVGALIVVALWLLSGFYLVSPGENAVITRFGAWTKTQIDPGLGYHLPWPIEKAAIVNVTVDRRLQIGFDDPGMRGLNGKRSIPDESQMLTADANIVEVELVVLWNIKDAKDYLFNVRDQEQTIRKVTASALREVVGERELWPILTGSRDAVQAQTQKIMQQVLDSYHSGVSIKNVTLQQATVHPDVTEAFEDVMAAKQDAVRFQNEANIYRNDIVPKARGQAASLIQQAQAYKQAVVTKAEGDAARFDAIYASYLGGKDVTRDRLYIETMEDVFGNAQKIIVDHDAAGTGIVPYMPLNELKPQKTGQAPQNGADQTAAPMPPQPDSAFGKVK